MKHMLNEYNVEQDVMTLYCDNPIDICHHFITEHVEGKVMNLEWVTTEQQLTYIFTKVSNVVQFEKLRGSLGIYLYENL